MTAKYQHTQKAGLPFYAVLAVGIAFSIMMFIPAPELPPVAVRILVPLIIFSAVLLMSSLTVTIDEQFLRVRFGPGIFFVKYPLSDIGGIGPKFTTYIWGWGIRWYFNGWLYNIAGFKSVEIILKNGKKRRIGTDEPEKLAQAIQESIA